MSGDAEFIANLRGVVMTLLGLIAALTAIIWSLAGRLDRGCAKCPHCHDENRKKDEEKERKRVEQVKANLRSLGVSEEEINRRLRK